MTKYLEESVHISAEDAKFMEMAIRLSEDNIDNGGGPFGAVIVRDGEVIATGTNRVVPNNDPTAHAEVMAIRSACEKLGTFQLTGCTVYSSVRAMSYVLERIVLGWYRAYMLWQHQAGCKRYRFRRFIYLRPARFGL